MSEKYHRESAESTSTRERVEALRPYYKALERGGPMSALDAIDQWWVALFKQLTAAKLLADLPVETEEPDFGLQGIIDASLRLMDDFEVLFNAAKASMQAAANGQNPGAAQGSADRGATQ